MYIDEDNCEKPLLTIFARRNIPPKEEITFSYSGDPDNEDPAPSPKKSKTKGKTKLQNDAVYTECRCGSRNCKGTMFGGEDDEDELGDLELFHVAVCIRVSIAPTGSWRTYSSDKARTSPATAQS